MAAMPREIVAVFQLTPELWFRASRCILQRQHRWLSSRAVWPTAFALLLALAALDFSGGLNEGLQPLLILLNGLVPLACLLLLLTPVLIRRRFARVYRRLPAQNRRVVWRFSPFAVSAEGGMTRFEGGWEDIREIVATSEFFLIFRQQKSAGVIPVSAFADAEALEDFVYLVRERVRRYVTIP